MEKPTSAASAAPETEIPPTEGANAESEKQEVFFHPETGEKISKNAYKKLLKGDVKKEKKEKVAPAPKDPSKEKEKKKKDKEPEKIYSDNTPWGDYKNIVGFCPETYQPQYVEAAWQAWWEKSGYYIPDMEAALESKPEDKFVMVIPPPNVTGSLHLGHALTTAIEDSLTRWHRMNGKITLWVPGVDHAGIATQSVVERMLMKTEGISKHSLGRDRFVEKVWEWKQKYGNRITSQQRFMGASVDWSREAFTMDAKLSKAVLEAFVTFHQSGLIYRDTRLINWSCALESALSDIEVDYIDLEGRTFLSVPNHKNKEKYEFGMITSFAYKVDGSETNEEIVVATTRLETMLGDTAVAVHPEDPRYKHLIGKMLQHPFVDRKIPIIADSILVDMNFGTGAVKVTPAHDPNDYLCGKRNGLEFIIVLTLDGKIAANGGKFAGEMRYDARISMEEALKELGLLRGKQENKMRLGLCSRTNDIIEPMLTPQWYLNCQSMAARSVDAVRNGSLKIVPAEHERTWFMWLENIRDWCISRQLWWGHRIPAYFARLPGEDRSMVSRNDIAYNDRWFVARSEEAARTQAAEKLGVSVEQVTLEQDEDVLDTWFSSGLFPFSVFGWPDETEDFKAFFPTSLLETGQDILFFWVARMVMMSLQLTDTLPFHTVYLHAMVRDKYGRKMSKALGNVIDPLEVRDGCSLEELLRKIEEGNLPVSEVAKAKKAQQDDFPTGIPACGTDALRFGLLAYTAQGRDINLDILRVVGYKQFCNKIWNAFRFATTYLQDFIPLMGMNRQILHSLDVSKRDRFILSRLNAATVEVNKSMESYTFANATTALYSFLLYDLCDVYLELVKPVFTAAAAAVASAASSDGAAAQADGQERITAKKRVTQATLYTVLEQYLRLLHPFMPFITEELWQRLPYREQLSEEPSIMLARYPASLPEWQDEAVEKDMATVREAINSARSLRKDYNIANATRADFFFRTKSETVRGMLLAQADDFCTLTKGNFLRELAADAEIPRGYCIKVVNDQLSLLVDLTGLLDVDAELARLAKEVDRLTPMITTYERKMAAKDYEAKVPEDVRTVNTEKLTAFRAEMDATMEALRMFESMKL